LGAAGYARIDHPSAWVGAEIGGREGLTHRLSRAQIAELEDLARELDGRELGAITRADAGRPLIDDLMRAVRHQVMSGYGAVIVSGLDLEAIGLSAFERLYWALGTHLGVGVIQSSRADLVGYVRREEGAPARGYTTDFELRPHTDFHEILSLASISLAAEGGRSGLVSGLSIHNVIADQRPDLMPPLYQGHPQRASQCSGLEPFVVPFFSETDGKVSCFFSRVFMTPEPSPNLVEALAFFSEVAARPQLRADFMLEPGEMLFWHNFQVLHSREAFKDSDAQKRLLLRLWINAPNGRPLAEPIVRLRELMDEAHRYGVEYGPPPMRRDAAAARAR
jgi:hypothetical protein